MEQASVPYLPPSLSLSCAAATASCFNTPPLTPLDAAPRTPRKPTNPVQTVLSVSREEAAIISFKMIQTSLQMSPSLQITSFAPAKKRASTARRRLWVQAGDTCDAFSFDAVPRPNLKSKRSSPSESLCLDGVDADDEMDGNSPLSCFSPLFSPSPRYMETISEAAAKPASSSYPVPAGAARMKKSAQFASPKTHTAPKSKTCASCKTKKTPLWRDSEDGIPYCNACGIRFKKYRFRCSSCLYIPRKDEREVTKACCRCGARLVHCKGTPRY